MCPAGLEAGHTCMWAGRGINPTWHFRFKDLRSDFGSRLANNGVDLAVTQRLLGHSSPVVTMKYYVSIQDQTMRDAVTLSVA